LSKGYPRLPQSIFKAALSFVLGDFLGDAFELNTCQNFTTFTCHCVAELAWYGRYFETFGYQLAIRCSFLATESVNG
jgi:hypothetical protein